MATAFTDFSGDSNGALANSASWTNGRVQGTWTFTVQTDAGATGGKSVLTADGGWGIDGLQTVLFDDVAGSGTTGDLEIVTRFKFNTAPATGEAYAVGAALVASAASQNAYALYYNGSGGWRLARWDGGAETVLQTATSLHTPANDSYMWIRLARSGTTIKANVWGGTAGDEPAGFNVSGATDTTYTTIRAGVIQQKASYALTFDVFGASDTGVDGSAPKAGGPSISSQPQSTTKYAGETATFSVTASGTGSLTYQWKRNGSDIGGATSSSYTTPALTVATNDGDVYAVVVTDSNGSTTSNNASLRVFPASSVGWIRA